MEFRMEEMLMNRGKLKFQEQQLAADQECCHQFGLEPLPPHHHYHFILQRLISHILSQLLQHLMQRALLPQHHIGIDTQLPQQQIPISPGKGNDEQDKISQ
jgi:hypothetical protein